LLPTLDSTSSHCSPSWIFHDAAQPVEARRSDDDAFGSAGDMPGSLVPAAVHKVKAIAAGGARQSRRRITTA
jgi:hypothetical protein